MIERLLDYGADIAGLITVPDEYAHKCAGYTDLTDLGLNTHKAVHTHKKDCPDFIRSVNADLMIVYGWQRIIRQPAFGLVDKKIGFHASLLPAYRGSAPVNWAIINGETETGVTMFLLDEEVDAGPILGQKAFPITEDDTCKTVYEKSSDAACDLLLEKMPEYEANIYDTRPNPAKTAKIWPRRRPEDGLFIPGDMTKKEVMDLVRALTHPYPGAFYDNAWGRTFVWSVQEPTPQHEIPDLLLSDQVTLQCRDGFLVSKDFTHVPYSTDSHLQRSRSISFSNRINREF